DGGGWHGLRLTARPNSWREVDFVKGAGVGFAAAFAAESLQGTEADLPAPCPSGTPSPALPTPGAHTARATARATSPSSPSAPSSPAGTPGKRAGPSHGAAAIGWAASSSWTTACPPTTPYTVRVVMPRCGTLKP